MRKEYDISVKEIHKDNESCKEIVSVEWSSEWFTNTENQTGRNILKVGKPEQALEIKKL